MMANLKRRKMLTKDEILDYLKEIKPKLQEDGIIKLGLFGSFARGNFHDFSDIDIFIETGDKFVKNMGFSKGILYYDMLKKQISNKFGVLVDLSDIASMSIDEKKEFLKDAINV
jgi:Predicted nucleotidyltransferases